MGYVLPIDNDVGNRNVYQQREKKNKMYIKKPYKVILNQKYNQFKKAPPKRRAMKRKLFIPREMKKAPTVPEKYSEFACLTGKGNYIDCAI